MKSFLEKLFAELPSFFSVFISALTSPSKLIDEIMSTEDESEAPARGIRFFIVAEVITLVIAYAMPEWSASKMIPSTDSALVEVGSGIVVNVLQLVLSCVVVIVAFRIVQHRVDTKRFTALFAYTAGVAMVLTTLANSTTNIVKVDVEVARLYGESEVLMRELEPHFGRMIEIQNSLERGKPITDTDSITLAILPKVEQIQANTSAIAKQPTAMITVLIITVVSLAVDVWMIFVGYLYTRRNGISTARYIVAVIIAIAGIILVSLAIGGATVGSQLQRSFAQ